MTRSGEVDAYLERLRESDREALQKLREMILAIVPGAEECISYQVPAYRVAPGGRVFAGFAAFKTHLSYLPFSGGVLARVAEAAEYGGTKSALHFQPDRPLPEALVRKLIDVRMLEISGSSSPGTPPRSSP